MYYFKLITFSLLNYSSPTLTLYHSKLLHSLYTLQLTTHETISSFIELLNFFHDYCFIALFTFIICFLLLSLNYSLSCFYLFHNIYKSILSSTSFCFIIFILNIYKLHLCFIFTFFVVVTFLVSLLDPFLVPIFIMYFYVFSFLLIHYLLRFFTFNEILRSRFLCLLSSFDLFNLLHCERIANAIYFYRSCSSSIVLLCGGFILLPSSRNEFNRFNAYVENLPDDRLRVPKVHTCTYDERNTYKLKEGFTPCNETLFLTVKLAHIKCLGDDQIKSFIKYINSIYSSNFSDKKQLKSDFRSLGSCENVDFLENVNFLKKVDTFFKKTFTPRIFDSLFQYEILVDTSIRLNSSNYFIPSSMHILYSQLVHDLDSNYLAIFTNTLTTPAIGEKLHVLYKFHTTFHLIAEYITLKSSLLFSTYNIIQQFCFSYNSWIYPP